MVVEAEGVEDAHADIGRVLDLLLRVIAAATVGTAQQFLLRTADCCVVYGGRSGGIRGIRISRRRDAGAPDCGAGEDRR
jgi:hypothetical protein